MAEPKTAKKLREVVKLQAITYLNHSISIRELKFLEGYIQSGQSLLITKISKTFTLHLVKLQREVIPVIYDKKRHCIESILPWMPIDTWLSQKPNNGRVYNKWRLNS